jgi:hypothetical protein
VGIIAAVFGVPIVMRIYADEVDCRVGPVLGGASSSRRGSWRISVSR